MTNEEIIEGMLACKHVPDYLERLIVHIAALAVDEIQPLFEGMVNASRAAGEAGKLALHDLNLALVKDPRFNAAVERYHAWKTTKTNAQRTLAPGEVTVRGNGFTHDVTQCSENGELHAKCGRVFTRAQPRNEGNIDCKNCLEAP